jgi:hypothetical protein
MKNLQISVFCVLAFSQLSLAATPAIQPSDDLFIFAIESANTYPTQGALELDTKDSCDVIFQNFNTYVDVKFLDAFARADHLYYTFWQEWDSQTLNTCTQLPNGHMLTQLFGVVEAFDSIGNQAITQWVQSFAGKTFYGVALVPEQPIAFSARLKLNTSVNGSGTVLGTPESFREMPYTEMLKKISSLQDAWAAPSNQTEVDSILYDLFDAATIDNYFKTSLPTATEVSLRTEQILILRNERMIDNNAAEITWNYKCPAPGKCLRP